MTPTPTPPADSASGHAPLKVMHVMACAAQGGAENIFLESVLALSEAPITQCVVTRSNNSFRLEQIRARNIPLYIASFDRFARWTTNRTLRSAIEKFDPDIIQYWSGRAGTFARQGRARTVGWYGGYYKLKRFRRCDFHVGLTADIIAHIQAQGVSPECTQLIHTYAEFKPALPTPRASLDTPEDAPLLLALARLHKKKGLDIALHALAKIPRAYLWIAGEGPLKEVLTRLAASLGLTDRVKFLGWRNDRGALLAAADICVFPSRYEPFGTVMVDAWAAQTPLVACAAAGPKAYVENEKNGLLVDIDDVEGLTRAITRLIHDEDLKARLIKGGQDFHHSRFTKRAFINESLDFYQRILMRR